MELRGAPVFEPGEERPVGLVDITGPWEVQRRQAILVARAIARAVQERIRAANSVRDEVMRHAFLALRSSTDAVLGVDARGHVIGANEAAKRRIVTAGALCPTVKKAIAEILRGPSRSPGSEVAIAGPEGKTIIALPVQYDGTTVGAILRTAAVKGGSTSPSRAQPSARYEFSRILGRSPPIQRAIELAKTAARNSLPVVLYGESGTGKELFAQAIHSASDRRGERFVAVNCGSIPAQLVEAELFGYESGTFTGARRDGNPGRFEDADGGTLFLDEVSELPLQAQTALLRVLQEREVVRLGGSMPRSVDVRVIAATNKPLEEEIRAKRFRRDLFYRLNVFFISVPPLRERGDEDLALLAEVFVKEAEMEVQRSGLTLSLAALAALHGPCLAGERPGAEERPPPRRRDHPCTCIRPEDLLLDTGAPLAYAPASAAPPAPPCNVAHESEARRARHRPRRLRLERRTRCGATRGLAHDALSPAAQVRHLPQRDVTAVPRRTTRRRRSGRRCASRCPVDGGDPVASPSTLGVAADLEHRAVLEPDGGELATQPHPVSSASRSGRSTSPSAAQWPQTMGVAALARPGTSNQLMWPVGAFAGASEKDRSICPRAAEHPHPGHRVDDDPVAVRPVQRVAPPRRLVAVHPFEQARRAPRAAPAPPRVRARGPARSTTREGAPRAPSPGRPRDA